MSSIDKSAELEEISNRHHERVRSQEDAAAFQRSGWAKATNVSGKAGPMGYCDACEGDWPCDTAVALAALKKAQERIDELESIEPWKLIEIAKWFDVVDDLLDQLSIVSPETGKVAEVRDVLPRRDDIQRDIRSWAVALAKGADIVSPIDRKTSSSEDGISGLER